jgi:hypothetical protein
MPFLGPLAEVFLLRRMTPGLEPSISHEEVSDVEADVEDVAVLDDVGLPFKALLPGAAASA